MIWKLGDKVDARIAYGEALLDLGKSREDIVVLDADLQRSNKTFSFSQIYPDRFFDMGISEADMISTAAGISSGDFVVFANSFAMFLPGRCYDQIRLHVAYAQSNVKLVGLSAGISIGPDGASQQSIDDIGLMRQLPNLVVIVPADANETYQAVIKAAEVKGPVYIRVSRYPAQVIYDENYVFEVGIPNLVVEGTDIVIFSTGIMVNMGILSADQLKSKGISASVVNVSTIKPLDKIKIRPLFRGKKLVVTLEEHSIIGGLGSAIAEILAETPLAPQLIRIGINDCFGQSGSPDELLENYGLVPSKITETIVREYPSSEGVGA